MNKVHFQDQVHFCSACKELKEGSSNPKRSMVDLRQSALAGCGFCEALVSSIDMHNDFGGFLRTVTRCENTYWPPDSYLAVDNLFLDALFGLGEVLGDCFIFGLVAKEKILSTFPITHTSLQVGRRSRTCHLKVALFSSFLKLQSIDILPVFQSADGYLWNKNPFWTNTNFAPDDYFELSSSLSLNNYKSLGSLFQHHDFALVSKWRKECITSHPNCSTSKSCFKPTRLLDVGNEITPPHLVDEFAQPVPYVALSYCWGNVADTLKTTRANIEEHRVCIKLSAIPQTIRDAIIVCRRVGVQFLWVDALCIIQDSDRQRDWYSESSKMQDIYSGATFVIAAHDSLTSNSGFLYKRHLRVQNRRPGLRTIYWGIKRDPEVLHTSALSKRGWTLQESLLASRILHFTDSEMIWECNDDDLQCESGSSHYRRLRELTRHVLSKKPISLPPVPQSECCDEDDTDQNIINFLRDKDSASLYWTWRRIVEEYSKRSLSRAEDKLIALSGLAKAFADCQAIDPRSSYLAGLWKNSIVQDMLWCTLDPVVRREDQKYVVPSWSWASATGQVAYFFAEYQFRFEELAEIQQASCVHSSFDPTGAVVGGSITITGQILPVDLTVKSPLSKKSKYANWYPTSSRWKSGAFAYVSEPGTEDLVEVLLDERADIGVHSRGYYCLFLGANVDRFKGSRRVWFLVVGPGPEDPLTGRQTYKRVGIGYMSTDWTLFLPDRTVTLSLV